MSDGHKVLLFLDPILLPSVLYLTDLFITFGLIFKICLNSITWSKFWGSFQGFEIITIFLKLEKQLILHTSV